MNRPIQKIQHHYHNLVVFAGLTCIGPLMKFSGAVACSKWPERATAWREPCILSTRYDIWEMC